MTEFKEKYVNPFTDYGFKKLFGEELNKDLLLDFLNELLKEEQGHIKNLTYEQIRSYEDSLKYYRDLKNSLDTAKEEGREEGFIKGVDKGIEIRNIEIAKNLLKIGNLSIAEISGVTGLSEEFINTLKY